VTARDLIELGDRMGTLLDVLRKDGEKVRSTWCGEEWGDYIREQSGDGRSAATIKPCYDRPGLAAKGQHQRNFTSHEKGEMSGGRATIPGI
jgi:hypothetical protein